MTLYDVVGVGENMVTEDSHGTVSIRGLPHEPVGGDLAGSPRDGTEDPVKGIEKTLVRSLNFFCKGKL